jgi:hypothetical protein
MTEYTVGQWIKDFEKRMARHIPPILTERETFGKVDSLSTLIVEL